MERVLPTLHSCELRVYLIFLNRVLFVFLAYSVPKKYRLWASLVAQWLGICLPMQGTRVRALVWEDPTYRGATGPVSHNY